MMIIAYSGGMSVVCGHSRYISPSERLVRQIMILLDLMGHYVAMHSNFVSRALNFGTYAPT